MVTTLEIIGYGELDLEDDIPLALNFNLNDVKDISNRGGVWSKTVKLPGTQKNNDILGNMYNVNLQTLTFNPILKENCRIMVDGLTSFEGIFQVRKINRSYKNSEDFTIIYDCYIKSDTSSFYETISGKYLEDIDLNEYNHTWTITEVERSMAQGICTDGYQYFLGFNPNVSVTGEPDYLPQDFIPAIYTKVYWDKIFLDAGYTYEFDELYTLRFDKLIIPYNGDKFKPQNDDIFKFRAGFGLATANLSIFNVPISGGTTNPKRTIVWNDDDNQSEDWNDPNSRYDTTTGRYNVSGYSGSIEFDAKYFSKISVVISNPAPHTPPNDIQLINLVNFEIIVKQRAVVRDIGGNIIGIPYNEDVFWIPSSDVSGPYNMGTDFLMNNQFNCSFLYDSGSFMGAETIELELYTLTQAPPSDPPARYFSPTSGLYYAMNLTIKMDPQSSNFGVISNKSNGSLGENSIILANKLIPKKIKQSDFILSIIKMYNLYIKEDRFDPTKLIIKTRDKFYEDGVELNWTKKVDTKSIDVTILSNTQAKRKLFTYKADTTDLPLKVYEDETKEMYGQLEYTFENEFIKGTDKLETIFSPTLITTGPKNGFDLTVPYIDSRTPKNNIRILYIGDQLQGSWVYYNGRGNIPGNFFYKYDYRYAGHFYPNPQNPVEDINFGFCDYYNIPNNNNLTDNNLFNRFYKKQMNIFKHGHILTAYFDLSYNDIITINLNERIYIHDSWWNINEITDFDMNKKKLTKVELITADTQVEKFVPNNKIFTKGTSSENVTVAINIGSILSSGGNIIGSGTTGLIIGGTSNIIQPGTRNSAIFGKSNNVGGYNNMIQGNNNKVSGHNVTIIGADNLDIEQNDYIQIGEQGSTINFGSGGESFQTLSITTVDATVTDLITIDASTPVDNVGWYKAYITGIENDGSTAYFSEVTAGVKNDRGVLTLVDKTDVVEKTEFTTATSDIVILGTDVLVQVTGEAATDINWICNLIYRV